MDKEKLKEIIGRVARIKPASLEEAELLTNQAVEELSGLTTRVAEDEPSRETEQPLTVGTKVGNIRSQPENNGMLRQLFRESNRTYTGNEIADIFEQIAPYDPKGLLPEIVKRMFPEHEDKSSPEELFELHKKQCAEDYRNENNTPQPEHKSIEELREEFHHFWWSKRAGERFTENKIFDFFLPHLNSRNLLEWATGNDTGVSSVALLRYMMGFEPNDWGFMAPSDRDDRGRCIRLLKKFPEWLDRLDEMKKFSGWEEQIPLIKAEFIESELGK